jgi:mannose-6-phosphate isomerase-like protein (cupin superfamily)
VIRKIFDNEQLLAIIIYSSFNKDGIEFFTPNDFSQQLAYMKRPSGYIIDPHVHNTVERSVNLTQEVLFVKSGRVRVDFYTDSKTYLESIVIQKGDVILLASGGHGFEMLEESELIEVKQGPYCGEKDKVRFEPKSDQINVTN